jgi:hypothetical protein
MTTKILKTNITFTYISWAIFAQRHKTRDFLKSYIVNLSIDVDVGLDIKQAKLAYLIFDDARNESALIPITDDDMSDLKTFADSKHINFENVDSDIVTFANTVEAASLGKLLKGKPEYTTVDGGSGYWP